MTYRMLIVHFRHSLEDLNIASAYTEATEALVTDKVVFAEIWNEVSSDRGEEESEGMYGRLQRGFWHQ